jgi:adenylylsulfate kinase
MPVVWFTGLSGSGKSTISRCVSLQLQDRGVPVEVLDADIVRKHLCPDLGYSRADRCENLRRISYVAQLLARHGTLVLVAAISPYRQIREELRRTHARFLEVFINASLEICEKRDVKGLYRRARAGLVLEFTGVSDVYEPPVNADVECRTDVETIEESSAKVVTAVIALLDDPQKHSS